MADRARKTNLTPERFSIRVIWRNTTWEQHTLTVQRFTVPSASGMYIYIYSWSNQVMGK